MNVENKRDWRDWFADMLGINPENRAELINLLQRLQQDRKLFSPKEMKMIEGVLLMCDRKIRDIMIPRHDIVALSINSNYAQSVEKVREWQHSRYPVFDNNQETVKGILLAKDLLSYTDSPASFKMMEVMRKPIFEPMVKTLDTMLADFERHHTHMVIAIDEFRQVAGIVTIEDVLEQIVGEIEDESDEEGERLIQPLDSGQLLVHGSLSLDEFNSFFKTNLPTDSADTIAGWLSAEMGIIPKMGDEFEKFHLKFKIEEASERRVYRIMVTPKACE